MAATVDVTPWVATSENSYDWLNWADVSATHMLEITSISSNSIQLKSNTCDFSSITQAERKNIGLLLFSPNVDIEGNKGSVFISIATLNYFGALYKYNAGSWSVYEDGFKAGALYAIMYNYIYGFFVVLNI